VKYLRRIHKRAIGLIHRACNWWAERHGLRLVNERHLSAMEDELRRLRHWTTCPDLSSFGREKCGGAE
jgi:hypothetical protein